MASKCSLCERAVGLLAELPVGPPVGHVGANGVSTLLPQNLINSVPLRFAAFIEYIMGIIIKKLKNVLDNENVIRTQNCKDLLQMFSITIKAFMNDFRTIQNIIEIRFKENPITSEIDIKKLQKQIIEKFNLNFFIPISEDIKLNEESTKLNNMLYNPLLKKLEDIINMMIGGVYYQKWTTI